MVYIKIPENAKPGEAIELKLQNVYSRCTRCGTEISFVDSYYRSEGTDEFIPQRLYCARCAFHLFCQEQPERARKYLGSDMFRKGLEED